jgi:hypothetical protein
VLIHCADPSVRVLVWGNELTAEWYAEHMSDLVDAEGRNRLFLVRYNLSSIASNIPAAQESFDYLSGSPKMFSLLDDGSKEAALIEPQQLVAHRTDILRLVILFRFGGVYVDVDILPLRPITGYGTAFAANLGNYDCVSSGREHWPTGKPIKVPSGETVTCICLCFLSFPTPGNILLEETLSQGLSSFIARDSVYGAFGAWVFMDAMRAVVADPRFDAKPIKVQEAVCWPQVLDILVPLKDDAIAGILRDCVGVHMMGGAHAKKYSGAINTSSVFGQVYLGAQQKHMLPTTCSPLG